MARSVLIVDDEQEVRLSIAGVLRDEGYQVLTAADASSVFELLQKQHPDVILLDVWMTGENGERQQEGLDILSRIKTQLPDSIVVIMSGHGTIETAVRATKLGAYDFIEKPLSLEKLLVILQNAFQLRDLEIENQSLRQRVSKNKLMIGESPAIKNLQRIIRRVAPTNSWVLITGENGTGKELVAHSIHSLSSRYDKPFIEVNCAAIPEELIESELFGHEKGAFTGATQLKRGKFDLANEGTLFLDEIADMSLKTQAKILRILQEQRFERVGGSETISVDVRVIAATNKDLEIAIRENKFREDLYYRLNVVPCRVPALRERKEDIALIARFYLQEFAVNHSEPKNLDPLAEKLLENYFWPGNVRELKNFTEQLVIFTDTPLITKDQILELMPQLKNADNGAAEEILVSAVSSSASLKDAKSEFEREFILRKLKENEWNVSKTAQILGIERSHLHKKIKSYGIEGEL